MRVVKFLIGLLLLPVAAVCTGVLADLLRGATVGAAAVWRSPEPLALGLGVGLAVLLFLVLPRPTLAYVVGHEATHALCALLRGARVKAVRVRHDGGAVTVSRSDAWIALAPYVLPAGTVAVLLAWGVFAMAAGPGPYGPFWIGAIGLTWGFHACFTVAMLLRPQPDVRAHGRLFSWAFIYVANVLVAGGILAAIVGAAPEDLVRSAAAHTRTLARAAAAARDVAFPASVEPAAAPER